MRIRGPSRADPGPWWAALLFALFAVAELIPSLTGARVLTPESLLYGYDPFSAVKPADPGPVNPLLSDVPTSFQPWAETARAAFHDGRFPGWDPTALLGVPLGANPQAQLLNPLQLPLRVLPLDWAYGFVAALKLWLAGFGTFLLARELRCGFWPAVVGGLALLACSYMVVWLQWPHTAAFCFVPWVLWLVERAARGSRGAAVALAVPVAMVILGGHPGTYVQALFLTVLYAVVRLALLPDVGARERTHRGLLMLGGLGIGVMLSAPELVPTLFNRGGSTGLAERAGVDQVLGAAAAKTALFPDWWGRPGGVGGGAAVGNYNERTVFTGVAALVLAAPALAWRERWRAWAPAAAIALVGGLVAFGVDPVHAVVQAIPPLDALNGQRMVFAVNLGVAVLAALGAQALADGRGLRAVLAASAGVLAVCLVAVAAAGPGAGDLKDTVVHFAKGVDFESAQVLRLTAVAWAALFAGATAVVAVAGRRFGGPAVVIALVALVALDGARFGHGYNPQAPDSARPAEPPSVAFLRRQGPGERMTALGEVLPPDSGSRFGLRDLRGHDPPDPPGRMVRLLRTGWPPVGYQSRLVLPASLDARGERVLTALGVRWVMTAAAAPRPDLSGVRTAYRGADARVLELSRAGSRAYVPARVLAVPGERAGLRALHSPRFRPGRDAVVEGGAAAAGRGTVRLTQDSPERVRLRARMRRGGLVVLGDSLRDGWSVRVDGRAARPRRVNSVVRGVVVPAGAHDVVWTYRVPGLRLGLAVFGLGLLLLVAGAVAVRRAAA